MTTWLLNLSIESTDVLAPAYAVAGALLIAQILPVPGVRAGVRRWWPIVGAAAALGALAGWIAVWIVVDVQDVFGAPASPVIRVGATIAGAGLGVGVVNVVRTRWWRRLVAIVGMLAVLVSSGLAINRDVAYYPRLGDALGITGVGALTLGGTNSTDASLHGWHAPTGMPTRGTVGTAIIPGDDSHWHGRSAWVYLPPAARVAHPPRLPVIVAFSGQPGGPSDVFIAGDLASTMNAIARRHHGVAPVVIVPDQLGAYNVNPMCVNSRMGDVARYVTDDVREWILRNLPVSANRREWTVAGFSEGGTCAVQFGTEYPAIFGSYLAISPELGPINGTVARSVHDAFGGSLDAWKAAQPIAVMKRKGRYRSTFALYTVGARDTRYNLDAPKLAAASRTAGMRTDFHVLPGVAHNWNTGAAGFVWGTRQLESWWGLP